MAKSYLEDLALITSSREFRRMQDKTQMFYTFKGEQYRTRLTHTIEVSVIAKQIVYNHNEEIENISNSIVTGKDYDKCTSELYGKIYEGASEEIKRVEKNLKDVRIIKLILDDYLAKFKLDEHLTEAIAFGHDLGHTPFGHVGEETLSNILCGKDDLGGLVKMDLLKNRMFKHNINSLRVFTGNPLRANCKGKLSWQVADGIVKHTKVYKDDMRKEYKDYEITEDPYGLIKIISSLNMEQIQQDFNNKMKDPNKTYISYNSALTLEGQVVAIADEIAQRVSDLEDVVRSGYLEIDAKTFSKSPIANTDFINIEAKSAVNSLSGNISAINLLCPQLRNYLIKKTVITSCDAFNQENKYNYNEMCCENYVKLSGEAERVNDFFDDLIKKQAHTCQEIRRCNSVSTHMIRQIFKAYLKHTDQIPDLGIRDIGDEIKEEINKVWKIVESYKRDENNGKIKRVEVRGRIYDIRISPNIDKDIVTRQIIKNNVDGKNKDSELYSTIIYSIAYYIAGMTDSFAHEEYKRLYAIKMPIVTSKA